MDFASLETPRSGACALNSDDKPGMISLTITEKILAVHAGLEHVRPGDLIEAKPDVILANDVTGPLAILEFEKTGCAKVADPERICFVMDHFAPCPNVKAAQQCKLVREFSRQQGIAHFYDVGRMGIEHALLPELGVAKPGGLIIGGDSHTCTYGALGAFSTGMGSTDITVAMASGKLWFKVPESIRFTFSGKLPAYVGGKDLILHVLRTIGVDGALYQALEFCGETIHSLSMDGRFTMCNMAIEAGAKNGIIAPDEKTLEYAYSHGSRPGDFTIYRSDPDAVYAAEYEFDVSGMEPLVAFPHLPSNVREAGGTPDIRIDQAVIGSCTNGRMEDLRAAAEIFRNKTIAPHVRAIIIPGTQSIYRRAAAEGLIDIFIEAGAAVSTPTCGPCFGGHMGILADGERAVSTTNRNFVGRMGSTSSEVYLAGPAVAAASAIAGYLAHPKEVQ